MKFIITYSADRNRPIDSWTEEEYDDREKAEQNALDLLYSGFYLRLDEQE